MATSTGRASILSAKHRGFCERASDGYGAGLSNTHVIQMDGRFFELPGANGFSVQIASPVYMNHYHAA
jgi:hypothetical protein